eukprot:3345603-Rhodomonas_salina.2
MSHTVHRGSPDVPLLVPPVARQSKSNPKKLEGLVWGQLCEGGSQVSYAVCLQRHPSPEVVDCDLGFLDMDMNAGPLAKFCNPIHEGLHGSLGRSCTKGIIHERPVRDCDASSSPGGK